MLTYQVEISANIPYPWPKSYRQEATSEGAAVSRALKQYRKDVRGRNGRSKKMTEFTLKVRRLKFVHVPGGEDGPDKQENSDG